MGDSAAFTFLAILSISVLAGYVLLALFGPGLRYRIRNPAPADLESEGFCRTIEVLADAQMHRDCAIEVLTNGDAFYPAELETISRARKSVNLEAYIFQKSEIGDLFVRALAERARAGVRVKIVLDGVGAFTTRKEYFGDLCDAGGRLEFYHPLRWHTWPRINNRTHRELIIVDGEVGFIGGAGIADHWFKRHGKQERWRDTMFRVTGRAVLGLQSTFCENWLEASGEILTGDDYFPDIAGAGKASAMIVNSSPTAGGSTRARILYQTLLVSARRSIWITTPYFLPDESMRCALAEAARERGVEVRILTPGRRSDHQLTRTSSRRVYGELLKAGARIFEYEPSMIHAKVLIIDGLWSVVGSTNFDHRSFGLNDEVNLAAFDYKLASRLEEDFERDLASSIEVTYESWLRRSVFERAQEPLGWLLERQQ